MNNSVFNQDDFVTSPIFEVAEQIVESGQITAAEQHILREIFLKAPLNEDEHTTVNRLYYALRRGYIKVAKTSNL